MQWPSGVGQTASTNLNSTAIKLDSHFREQCLDQTAALPPKVADSPCKWATGPAAFPQSHQTTSAKRVSEHPCIGWLTNTRPATPPLSAYCSPGRSGGGIHPFPCQWTQAQMIILFMHAVRLNAKCPWNLWRSPGPFWTSVGS